MAAYARFQCSACTGSHTVAAECAVNRTDLAVVESLHIDVLRAFLDAEPAFVAEVFVFHDVKKLELWSGIEDFQHIAQQTECSQQHGPWNICSKYIGYEIYPEQDTNPKPEFQRVRNCTQRAEVLAPEHVDEEAPKHDACKGYD